MVVIKIEFMITMTANEPDVTGDDGGVVVMVVVAVEVHADADKIEEESGDDYYDDVDSGGGCGGCSSFVVSIKISVAFVNVRAIPVMSLYS